MIKWKKTPHLQEFVVVIWSTLIKDDSETCSWMVFVHDYCVYFLCLEGGGNDRWPVLYEQRQAA